MSESVNPSDLNAMIGNLLANPTALSGMMNLIGSLRAPENSEKERGSEEKHAENEKKEVDSAKESSAPPTDFNLSSLLPILSGAGALAPALPQKKNTSDDPMKRRRCLLEAIRPYLSPTRCENLNLLLRILDVLSLLSPKK